VGREREIAQVRQHLAVARLVTLTGPGGCGKTRLALRVAESVSPGFRDGVYFVPLAQLTDADAVVASIAQVLGVKESADKPILDRLKEDLRARQALLVLDNFEHVVEAAGAVAELLAGCSDLKILSTSRVPLHLQGEQVWPVPPMSIPSRANYSDALMHADAVRLFAERAQAIRPDFALSEENTGQVVESCRRLDGLPLAIELAAARLNVFSPAELLDRLGSRLRLLTGRSRDLPARQRTLRSTMDWSYQLLSDEEKRLFRRLSVFVGGFTLESAAAVGDDSAIGNFEAQFDTMELLDGLVDKSLVQRDENSPDATRFTMLETIHEFAREMLAASDEASGSARSHAAYFLAQVAGDEPRPTDTTLRAPLDWLERERYNLLTALRWFRDDGDVTGGLRLAGALWFFWYNHGPRSEGREWLATFLGRVNVDTPLLARASALLAAGYGAITVGDPAAARAELDEGLAIARNLRDRSAEADFLACLGIMESELGNLDAAGERLAAALAIHRTIGSKSDLAGTLGYLGDVVALRGDDVTARQLYEEGLALATNDGWFLGNLALVALRAKEVKQASDYLRESLARYQAAADHAGQVECLNAFAGIAIAQRRWINAARLLGAVAGLQRTVLGGGFHGDDQRENERFLAATRAWLSAEEFANAWAEGQTMTLEQALAYAEEGG
jgi:non-specific serine/threonine protein kinase